MQELMAALMIWASNATGLPVAEDMPVLVLEDRCAIQRMAYADENHECTADGVQAIYDHRTEAIYLPDTWSPTRLYDVSLLLHELIHHMQNEVGTDFDTVDCPGRDLERPAYTAQAAFIKGAGIDPWEVMRINQLALYFITTCQKF